MDGIDNGAEVTVACRHCGGAVKPAARICKHCKRSLEVRRDSAPMAAVGAAVPPLPPVLLELRSFLTSKRLVEPTKIDQLLGSRTRTTPRR